ncbi:TetR family transcriptional regulator [Nocardioides sp. WL0053]|uniref:TetR family transcriptional regulator n=1 Tax=Nocardioides jiangsuensis TaxID=2866161 RepID=A0ABS7RJY5_9ACTN|nr:TetR family transcriptional regulator [Nocardioides jiangsuensis]MBY9075360.1 TetR family transcriptional regulator [Nocardioides jiangsuensis]
MTEVDGRRARGLERRRQLIAAALRVLEREGLAGFNHRAVAAEAGVALASATYHFTGIDDLAVSAMLAATEEFTESLCERADGVTTLATYATALADELAHHRGRVVAGYELYLLAARRPALRDAAVAWARAGTEPLLAGADPVRTRAFLAVVDSLCLEALLSDSPPTAGDIEALLAHALA